MAHDSEYSGFDSGQQSIGTVYAKALIGAAAKANTADQILAELDSFVGDVIARLPKLDAVLSSPRIGFAEKERLLDRSIGPQAGGAKASPLFLNFLKVVCRHGRFDCLRAIQRAAHRLYNELRGRIEVRVRTAAPVDDALLASIAERLRAALGGEIEMRTETDPRLLGGLEVRVGDTVYDGSLAGQLRRLHAEALANTTQHIRQAVGRFAS